ncbi:heavy-metal-associated domain-containing protein [Aequorivita marina]|uniref:heavy-metal-associated domain-containing protein n=1 Tax=Aequorivita marina TaxID=3073654 RepID=UPI002875888E|nr:heavy-metal-associated domain-containing protein [Aequorivita sp. S2608]MDS1297121.1 heavy-metal-associated domain-containing protein [Aequorivita sp. S2608]
MNIISENVIPGDHGKVFETNAENQRELETLKKAILKIEGVKDVLLNNDTYPREITVLTKDFVNVSEVEQAASSVDLHVLPRALFHL